MSEAFLDTRAGPHVRGFLHTASGPDVLVLTHGASGNCEGPLLVALAESFAAAGISVLRCDLPFRQLRPHGPPQPGNAVRDQEGLCRAIDLLKPHRGRIFLGGQSYGGRQASILVAAEPLLVAGLLLLSYPLHPPARQGQLRTAHFSALRTPSLFVSGTRDSFGTLEEIELALRLIPAANRLLPIEAARHNLMSKGNRGSLPGLIVSEFLDFFGYTPP